MKCIFIIKDKDKIKGRISAIDFIDVKHFIDFIKYGNRNGNVTLGLIQGEKNEKKINQ